MISFKLTGDFAELQRFQKQLEKASETTRILSANLAEATIELIREGFEHSKDPYGKKWEPLKLRSGQPLRDTGGLQASWHKKNVTMHGFSIASGKDYAQFHQGGTGIHGPKRTRIKPVKARALRFPGPNGVIFAKSVAGVPRRRMVPDRTLPARWRDRYVRTAEEVLTELFKP